MIHIKNQRESNMWDRFFPNKNSHKDRILLESFHKINDIERNKRPKSYKRVGHQCPNHTLSSTTKKAE